MKLGRDRRRELAAGRMRAHRPRLVEADIDADCEIGRVADEPGVALVIGGAGLAGHRLADRLQGLAGAALDHPFEHRGDLIGGVGDS